MNPGWDLPGLALQLWGHWGSPWVGACPLWKMLVPGTGQTNPPGAAGSVPALLPPPPRQLFCLSFLGALPYPLPIEVSELPAHPKPQTRFLRAWEARAAPAQLPGRGELPADVRSSAVGRAGGKTGSPRPSGAAGTGPHRALPQSWMSLEGRDVAGAGPNSVRGHSSG